jgi:hypothetical protein
MSVQDIRPVVRLRCVSGKSAARRMMWPVGKSLRHGLTRQPHALLLLECQARSKGVTLMPLKVDIPYKVALCRVGPIDAFATRTGNPVTAPRECVR